MSRTKRNIPDRKLSEKEKKLAEKNKLKHGLESKTTVYDDPNFSQSAKKEAKREKHRKQRHDSEVEIEDQMEDQE